MSSFVFTPQIPALPIRGRDDLFPVSRIFCVGQNYVKHALEMGAKKIGEGVPIFFMKPADCIAQNGAVIPYPPHTGNLHHEVELAVALGANAEIFGSAVALDLTRRDLQTQMKEQGRPWELGKVFDAAAPCSAIVPGPVPANGFIRLSVNGNIKQDGDLSDMIWPVPRLLSILSEYITLQAGDLILTGTPSGVGPLQTGDVVRAEIENIGDLTVTIGSKKDTLKT